MSYSEDRQLVKIIREICQENNIALKEFSESWIMQLEKDKKSTYIYGYKFENNSATTLSICNDKAATYQVLSNNGVDSVKHDFFMRYKHTKFSQLYSEMLQLLNKYKTIVVKNNTGSGGKLVFKVSNKLQLKQALKKLLKHTKFICVSPYVDIQKEYRCVMCDNNVELIYEKVRPSVTGNGKLTIKKLISELPYEIKPNKTIKLNYIPKKGEVITLNWKHNLYYGASAKLNLDNKTKTILTKIAKSTTKILKAKFVSVDIVLIGNTYKVLEVNSGIMMEKFSSFSHQTYDKAKQIYTKAILSLLN